MSSLLESVQGMTVGAVMQLPRGALSAIAGAPLEIDRNKLDLHVQALFQLMNASRRPRSEALPVEDARIELKKIIHAVGVVGSPEVSAVDETFIGPTGPVPIRIYRPRTAPASAPVLVYYHGGGWVIGDLDTHDGICRTITEKIRCITLAVDYRLAPENPFPAAVDDALAAFRWAAANARRLGGDPERVGVGGDSAGANLAAVVSQLAVGQGGSAPFLQALFFPPTNLSTETASYELFAEVPPLYRSTARWFHDHYLPRREQRSDPRCSPLLADKLDSLPRAYVATAGFDVLRDEGIAYADRLRVCGVEVEHRHHPELPHGYSQMGRVVPEAAEAFDQDLAAIRRLFG